MNLWSFLEHAATHRPDGEALCQGPDRLSYATARERALRFAGALAARGVRAGDRVAVLCPNTVAHYLLTYAVDALGAILVPLNTRLSAGEQRDILRDAGATLLVHDPAAGQRAAELASAVGIAIAADGLLAQAPRAPVTPAPTGPDAIAQLYYTSGTTGRPKGVMLTHRNVVTHAHAAISELGLSAADRWAHVAPMFHLADAWATFAITRALGTHAFLPRFTAADALDLLERERITITNLVPTMLNVMVKEHGAADRRYALRTMLSGGAPIAPEVVRQVLATFRCDYVQTYGMTETSPYLTLSLLHDHLKALPFEERLRYRCKTGRPFRGVDLRVVGTDGAPVPADGRTVGEIRVKGATVTPGYWNQPEATAAAFDEHGYLKTGDLATFDAEGYVDTPSPLGC